MASIERVRANELSSTIVGYNKVVCLGGSDTVISVPFFRTPVYRGRIDSSPALNGLSATITPSFSPTFVVNQFESTAHYLRFIDGGQWFEISGNDASTITIETDGENLDGIVAQAEFEIIPHWTLDTLFPPATQGTVHLCASPFPADRKSGLLLADVNTEGTDLAPDRIFFLTENEGWVQAKGGFSPAGDYVIRPDQVMIVRHRVGEADTFFYSANQVHANQHRSLINTSSTGDRDNSLSLMRPVPVKLSDLDLDTDVFVDSTSTSSGGRKDELLIYDNAAVVQNKVPTTTYFRVGGNWRKDDGSTFPVVNDDLIEPSSAIVIRKKSTTTGDTLVWFNSPRY